MEKLQVTYRKQVILLLIVKKNFYHKLCVQLKYCEIQLKTFNPMKAFQIQKKKKNTKVKNI